MKKIFYILAGVALIFATSCEPQTDDIESIGSGPINGIITINDSNPYKPIFTAKADNGFIYHWDFDNGQKGVGNDVTSYFPFPGTYSITCIISGAGGKNVTVSKSFNVSTMDPNVATAPVWKELTGSGSGRTWIYNTDPATGFPDYCFQTYWDLANYPNNWKPENSWGQCVRLTPDLNGKMIFDLNGGINYTYHQNTGDTGIMGSFLLDTDNMTITITDPYILDHAVDCTNAEVTLTGVFDIKLLTDDEMILWQNQQNGTGWSWSFKSID